MTSVSTENRFAPEIPNGWFAVAWSRELRPGEVHRIRAFGEDLVLFRTHSGVPRVLSAYCPHLGAHLAEGGRVMGESIRCPFHGWQYDGGTTINFYGDALPQPGDKVFVATTVARETDGDYECGISGDAGG